MTSLYSNTPVLKEEEEEKGSSREENVFSSPEYNSALAAEKSLPLLTFLHRCHDKIYDSHVFLFFFPLTL